MKLSKYQKKIIDKIVTGEVFDIPSYLKSFCKGKYQKYDLEKLRNSFREEEREKLYKVMKDGHSAYMHSTMTQSLFPGTNSTLDIPFPRKPDSIADNEWKERPAELDENIPFQKEMFAGEMYSFDFKDNGVFVADSFESIVDFITLWTYLENEALVLSVDKPISAEDIGVFFESNNVESPVKKDKISEQKRKNEEAVQGLTVINFFQSDFFDSTPVKRITEYIDVEWKINEEHMVMCKKFVGKRILVGSALRLYQRQKYKTNEEKAQKHSLTVAWIAVVISIISVFSGSILPLFQSKGTDYLQTICRQLSTISDKIDQINSTTGS